MATLVVYYSRSGVTKKVAAKIREAFDAEVEQLTDTRDRRGVRGWVRSILEATLRLPTSIRATSHHPSDYDLVIVGTPVWNASVSSPVRTYLEAHRETLRNVAFFCTLGGRGDAKALAQMEKIVGRRPIAKLAVREGDVHKGREQAQIDPFVGLIRREIAYVPGRRPEVRARA